MQNAEFGGIESLVEIVLPNPENFLKIKETLTRIGVASKKDKTLYQSCLPGRSRIITEDGEKTIREIVETSYSGKVKSVNSNGEFEWNKILSHSVKDNKNKTWITLISTELPSSRRLTCTTDHRVGVVDDCFNPAISFVEAKDCLGKYLVRAPVNNGNQFHNVSEVFTKDQIEFLVGTILGDACITTKGGIQIVHCVAQQEYIEEKQKLFGGNLREFINVGFGAGTKASMLSIHSNEQTKKIREMCYVGGKKRVEGLIPMLTEKSLAYWYMDDGCIVKTRTTGNFSYYSLFSTEGFSYEDNQLLARAMQDKFGFDVKVDTYNTQYKGETKTYSRLRLSVGDSEKMWGMIAPYMCDCMRYKIPEKFHHIPRIEISPLRLQYALHEVKEIREVTKDYNKSFLSSKLYDIEVENTHNFIANNTLVHNCHILYKQGKYYIVHFKEMFGLDGCEITFDEDDLCRRNTIINLLEDWNLLRIVNPDQTEEPVALMSSIKVLTFKEKPEWVLSPKYNIGKKKH